MVSRYNLIEDFTPGDTAPDAVSVNPFWFIVVIRYEQPNTIDKERLLAGFTDVSKNSVTGNGAREDGRSGDNALVAERDPLVISYDLQQLNISATKSAHNSTLSATIVNGGEVDYLDEIQPNDWVMAWMVNNEAEGVRLISKITSKDGPKGARAANGSKDGLKFIGRVESIRKNIEQIATGIRTVRYSLGAVGFKEFDCQLFYNPYLNREEDSFLPDQLAKLGIGHTKILEEATRSAAGINITKAIPVLMELFFGLGIPPKFSHLTESELPEGPQVVAGFGYVVPWSVLDILNQSSTQSRPPIYADILEVLIGIQKYPSSSTQIEEAFAPDGASSAQTNHRVLNDSLLGSFMPMPLALDNRPVWEVLKQFENPAVNEMYTALRVNPEGRIVPTLIVRQIPFSSRTAVANSTDPSRMTAFHELPRWVAHPILVRNIGVGKSDATHINLLHIAAQPVVDAGVNIVGQIAMNPPLIDTADMLRNGLRAHMQKVECASVDSTFEQPKEWMKIAADFLLGHQFTLNGSCTMVGIQAPICPGDNFEFDKMVYHIEAVSHSCSFDPNTGHRQFATNLNLSFGQRATTGVTETQSGPNKTIVRGSLPGHGYHPATTVEQPFIEPNSTPLPNDLDPNSGGVIV